MRYFLDTEFIEKPGSIQLISIGIVNENGRSFYAENTSFDERDADKWVKENVLNNLFWWGTEPTEGHLTRRFVNKNAEGRGNWRVYGPISLIKSRLLEYFADDDNPIFYGYYADYDWVIFCWIFGKMIDLPADFPMYCRDLKQILDESGKDKIADPEDEHNALTDALWNKELYEHLMRPSELYDYLSPKNLDFEG